MPTSKKNSDSTASTKAPAEISGGSKPSSAPLGKATEKEYRARVRALERKVEQLEKKLAQSNDRVRTTRDEATAAKQAHRKELRALQKDIDKESRKAGTLEAPLKETKDELRALRRKHNALELRSTETIERLTMQVQHLQANSESTATLLEEAWSAVEQQKVRVDGADSRELELIEEHRKQIESLQRALERAEVQNQVMSRDLRETRAKLEKGLRSTTQDLEIRENELSANLTREQTERETLTLSLTEIEKSLQQERARYKALHDDQRQKTQHYQSEVLKFNRLVEESKSELSRLRQQVSQHDAQQRALAARARAREETLSADLEDAKRRLAESSDSVDREAGLTEQLTRVQAERNNTLEALQKLRLTEVENKRMIERLNVILNEKEDALVAAQEQCTHLERLYEDTVNAATENDRALRDYIVKTQARTTPDGEAPPAAPPPGEASQDPEQVAQLRNRSERLGDQLDLARDRERTLMAQLEKLTTMIGQIHQPEEDG